MQVFEQWSRVYNLQSISNVKYGCKVWFVNLEGEVRRPNEKSGAQRAAGTPKPEKSGRKQLDTKGIYKKARLTN